MQHGLGSLRGAIGTPEQVLDLCRRYEAAGVDQVIFVLQAGPNRHEHICESLELFAERVMPEFADGREQRERRQGASGSAPAVTRALARREPPREAPPGYVIDEPAELERAARARREGGAAPRWRAGRGGAPLAARGGQEALARLVRGASDDQLERRFGSDAGPARDLHRDGEAVRAEVRASASRATSPTS